MRQIPTPLVLMVLMLLMAGSALGSPEGMVTRLNDTGEVVVNRGVEDQVTPGTHWFVYRNGQPVAELEVVLVDSYTSNARVVQGSGIRIGDKVSEKAFTTALVPLPEEKPRTEARTSSATAATTAAQGVRPASPPVNNAEEAEAAYNKLLASSTQKRSFAGGAQTRNNVKIDPLNALNTLTTFGYGGKYWYNIWDLVSVGAEIYGTNSTNASLYQDNRVELQVTWLSDALLESQADSLAFRENKSSMEDRLAMRANLFAQKGLDKYVVFAVKLINKGPGTVQLSPFHWHLYLVDAQGNRLKSDRYDQVLDRTLNPDQSVEGNMYFLKTDVSGKPVLAPGAVKIVLEDILGERAEMSF